MATYFKKGVISDPQEQEVTDGIPRGGVTDQMLVKLSRFDYKTKWVNQPIPLVEQSFYSSYVFESASISGITEERAIAYAIALG
jgi:hypothetical protein